MVVETDLAADALRLFRNRPDARDFGFDPLLLLRLGAGWLAAAHHPKLRMEVMLLQNGQNRFCILVECRRKPPGSEFNAMFSTGFDLGIEGRDVLGPPVVGHPL